MRAYRLPALSAGLWVMLSAGAWSATPAPPPPGGPPPPLPALPVPDSVVNQARAQAEGQYGVLTRPRTPGQIQPAWDEAAPDAAVYTVELCGGCSYKVRLRAHMVTVIELPRGETIEAVDLGDNHGFSVQPRGTRRLAVRPAGQGYDTSLIVYGGSGALYPFYLRAEGVHSAALPDMVVRIVGAVAASDDLAVPGFQGPVPTAPAPSGPPLSADLLSDLAETDPVTPPGDFVAAAPFDPDALRGWGDYRLWGDAGLRPETVFRDEHFTYIRFGARWADIELPTAYVVVDGIDELVNTRVQGSTYIVESTRPLIVLKSGQSYLCIEYEGAE